MSTPGRRETEIKLRIPSADAGRWLLLSRGFRLKHRRTFEDNLVFDTPDQSLRRKGALVRVRLARRTATLTYKGPGDSGRHKSREEIETELGDGAAFESILERIGFSAVFRYQKYRTEYAVVDETGLATLDETPIGCFLELEGTPRWIDRTAKRLGFSPGDYVTASYGRLYVDFCKQRGLTARHMVFPGSKTISTIWRT